MLFAHIEEEHMLQLVLKSSPLELFAKLVSHGQDLTLRDQRTLSDFFVVHFQSVFTGSVHNIALVVGQEVRHADDEAPPSEGPELF